MAPAADGIRLGVVLIPTDPWPESVADARRIEALGYHHLWVYDHLTWRRYRDRPWHGIYPWLTGIATATERIRVGTMVSSPNIRHPVTLAKDAMTIDHISAGRLTIGLGAGGLGFDATAFGQDELSPGQRVARFAEFASVLDGLLRGELTNHEGRWYTVDEARMIPGCVQSPRVPLALAGRGPRGVRVAARLGDAWITNGGPLEDPSPSEHRGAIAAQVRLFERTCEEAGRDPATVGRIVMISGLDGKPMDSIDNFDETVDYYRGLGFTDLVFHHPRSDDPHWNHPPEIVEAIAERHLV